MVALGGNALMRRGRPMSSSEQRANVAIAAEAVARLAIEHEIVLTHGNGPQVGMLALQSDTAPGEPSWPLDVLGAESEGLIGYPLELALQNRLPERHIVALLTRVEVRREDQAFRSPTKPIGPIYDAGQAKELAARRGWNMVADGPGWRRAVPSPQPVRILELPAIRLLVEFGAIVICSGGGGIPVAMRAGGPGSDHGEMEGIEAVIDKDLAAALLARELQADALLMLTDVDAVFQNWGRAGASPINFATPDDLRKVSFDAGSMGPKVEAACRFVEAGGRQACIGRLEEAAEVLASRRGTTVASRRR